MKIENIARAARLADQLGLTNTMMLAMQNNPPKDGTEAGQLIVTGVRGDGLFLSLEETVEFIENRAKFLRGELKKMGVVIE